MLFWSLAVLMCLGALAFTLYPLVSKRRPSEYNPTAAQRELNLVIFQSRRRELRNDLNSGHLSQEAFEQAEADLKRELLSDLAGSGEGDAETGEAPASKTGVIARYRLLEFGAVGVLAVALGMGLYIQDDTWSNALPSGSADARQAGAQGPAGGQAGGGQSGFDVEAAVAALKERLEEEPERVDGWRLLGRTLMAMGRFDEAVEAYGQLYALEGDRDADVVGDYAEARLFANEQAVDPAAVRLFERALELDPGQDKALWYLGGLAFDDGAYEEAVRYWERLAETDIEDPAVAEQVDDVIAQARQRLGTDTEGGEIPRLAQGPEAASEDDPSRDGDAAAQAETGTDPVNPAGPPTDTDGPGIQLPVAVSVAPELEEGVDQNAVVFVYAQAAQGSRVPLAIAQVPAGRLPTTVVLDERSAMVPNMTLSNFEQVRLVARISTSGSAAPQAGDLQGTSGAVSVAGGTAREVVIDQRVQ